MQVPLGLGFIMASIFFLIRLGKVMKTFLRPTSIVSNALNLTPIFLCNNCSVYETNLHKSYHIMRKQVTVQPTMGVH